MIRVTKGSVLGPDQFNIFFNILDNGIKYIPGKFTDDTKLEGVNDLPEGHTDTQMNHDRLEKQAHKKNLITFNKKTCKVLHLGPGACNPCTFWGLLSWKAALWKRIWVS